jgi:PPOX class probable F420-dependent enzyme
MEFSDRQLAYLSYPHYAVLATINTDGSPQLSTVWFSLTDDRKGLFFVIEQGSLKARNLGRDSRVSVSVPNGGRYVVAVGRAQFDPQQSPESAQADLLKIATRYYGAIEGANQVASFGEKERLTIYLYPEKINSVGV